MQSSITRMWRRYTIVGVIFSIALTGCPNPTSDSGDSPVLSDDDEWSYEVVGSAPIPGDNGVIDVSRSGDTYTFRFAEASDTETDREDLRYAAFTSSSEIIGQSVDLQYLVATSEVDPQWFEYGGFQISSLRGPIYFNVGVRDSDGNISAYQAVYVAPEPSAASYTVDPTVYENDDTIEINASDGSDIIYVVTNTLEGTTEHDTESIDSDWFSPEGSTSSEPLHDVTTDVYRGTLSGSSFSGGSAPRGIGLRGFPGQHNPLQMVDEPSEVGDDDSGADGSIVGSQLSGSAAIGSEESFSTHSGDLNATAVANATTGDWNLTVWLDNADTAGVTQAMIDAIVTRFMREGDENDIFDWVSGVYGDPWGEREDSRLISSDRRDVHILFYDIDGDGAPSQFQSRTVGYFWPKDNYAEGSQISDGTTGETVTSNGKLMFYMDSELLSIRDGASWDIEDFWPAEVVSTLAHEFQHMVHFYQRQVI
ncbi:MAG: M30 family zinc metallopeptidase, partial [Alkalispirochaeta sp.]